MKKRYKNNPRKDKRKFNANVKKTHKLNTVRTMQRGGTTL